MSDDDIEGIINLIDVYLHDHFYIISRPDFEEILVAELRRLCELPEKEEDSEGELDEHGMSTDDPNRHDVIYSGLYYYYLHIMPRREFSTSFIYKNPSIPDISAKISYILSKPQPVQKTLEWYDYRREVITASNLYKVFGSQAVKNELIYEKCKPPKMCIEENDSVLCVNTNTSLHWGNKYEPLSILIYESMYATTISSLGCITHDMYSFIGASPDGINNNPLSLRHGRLVEIKNVKSRDIDGSISEPYWIQMQIQMEVCDLNECDFVETKFIEYEGYNDYVSDNVFECDDLEDGHEYEYTKYTGKIMKGMMLYFHKPNEPPKYVYKPLCISLEDEEKWELDITEEHVSNGYQWITNVYWKLVVFNCQLVLRNKFWFANALPHVSELWQTILKERETGFDHRKPNTRIKKTDQWMY